MPGLKEICALLLAGGVGAGSVVTVQEVKPKPRVERKAPAAKKVASRPAPARPKIVDCPSLVAPLGGALVPQLAEVAPPPNPLQPIAPPWRPTDPFGPVPPSGGGGGGGLFPPVPPPPPGAIVPEPAAWAMMVSGFGLVGVALRIRPRSTSTPTTA